MSNLDSKYIINLDLMQDTKNNTMHFNLSDSETSDFWINITRYGVDINEELLDKTVTLYVVKPNKNVEFGNISYDSTEKMYYFNLSSEFKNIKGNYTAQVVIYDSSTKERKVTRTKFKYYVEDDILSDASGTVKPEEQENILDDVISRLVALEDNGSNSSRVASNISITDTGNYFAADQVEGALQEVGSQIKEKASKSEVFLIKNGININDFDEETRQTFLNQQGIDVNYVLGEGNVKYENLSKNIQSDFLDGVTYLENLLDTTKFVVGGLYSDGSLNSDVTDNYCSDFISVTPNKVYYRLNTNIVVIGYYDIDKNFIDRPTIQEGVDNFTIPYNVYYIRYTNTKDNMLTEVISSVPITKYNNYLNGIYEISGKYKLLEHSIGIEELETNMPPTFLQSNSITKDLLSNYILGEPEFLANGFDLNTLGRDGYFVCTDCINKPDGMGTAFLTNKVFLSAINYGRWAIQEIYDFTDVSNRYIRTVDLENSTNTTAWISLKQISETPEISKSKFEGKKLVTIGDSITQGVGATYSTKNYPSVLSSKYGFNVVNAGIAGATWANYNDGYDDISIIHQVDNTDFSNTDFVTIFAGTNDFGRDNGNTIGNTTDTVTNTVKGAMNYVIGKILTQNPEVKIAIITPMWRQRFSAGDNKDSDTNTLGGQYLIDYVNAIEEQAKYNHIPCLNLYETCLINKHNYSIYLSDGLHPNDKGYELLADKICGFLESVY